MKSCGKFFDPECFLSAPPPWLARTRFVRDEQFLQPYAKSMFLLSTFSRMFGEAARQTLLSKTRKTLRSTFVPVHFDEYEAATKSVQLIVSRFKNLARRVGRIRPKNGSTNISPLVHLIVFSDWFSTYKNGLKSRISCSIQAAFRQGYAFEGDSPLQSMCDSLDQFDLDMRNMIDGLLQELRRQISDEMFLSAQETITNAKTRFRVNEDSLRLRINEIHDTFSFRNQANS
jgi:hypothetical protein